MRVAVFALLVMATVFGTPRTSYALDNSTGLRVGVATVAGAEVEARDDFTAGQKRELAAIIESRKDWYAESGLCRASRKA